MRTSILSPSYKLITKILCLKLAANVCAYAHQFKYIVTTIWPIIIIRYGREGLPHTTHTHTIFMLFNCPRKSVVWLFVNGLNGELCLHCGRSISAFAFQYGIERTIDNGELSIMMKLVYLYIFLIAKYFMVCDECTTRTRCIEVCH